MDEITNDLYFIIINNLLVQNLNLCKYKFLKKIPF